MTSAQELISAALVARQNAYARYSGFAVGAAVATPEGHVFTGCNVENSAYPEGMCAEASAIAAMVTAGHQSIAAIAVVGGDKDRVCMPCGGCRQKIQEFGTAETRVYVATSEGQKLRDCTLAEILPFAFS